MKRLFTSDALRLDSLIAYLEDFNENLCPGKTLYVKITGGDIELYSDAACTKLEATI